MNIETGEIMRFPDDAALRKALEDQPIVEINEKEMTPRQKKEMRVSAHDNHSILGRKFTSARKARKAARKSS